MKLTGRWTVVRAWGASDAGWTYATATDPRLGGTWRLHGATPAPDDFLRFLWEGVALQCVVEARRDGRRIGLVQLFNADWRSGTAHLSVLFDDEHHTLGWPLEGVILVLDHAFEVLGLRRVYLESAPSVFERYASAAEAWLQVDASLTDGTGAPAATVSSIGVERWEHEPVARLLRGRGGPDRVSDPLTP